MRIPEATSLVISTLTPSIAIVMKFKENFHFKQFQIFPKTIFPNSGYFPIYWRQFTNIHIFPMDLCVRRNANNHQELAITTFQPNYENGYFSVPNFSKYIFPTINCKSYPPLKFKWKLISTVQFTD